MFTNRGLAVLNGLRFDWLCLMVAWRLDNVAVSDGQCLMVAETLGRCMTMLLSSLMEGIYCRFSPLLDN